ncbi:MAG: galactokinase family protein [Ignisphaera sp.]
MSEQLQVDLVVKEFKDIFRSKHEVVVSAPGRLDFLNTHQDYKGLPVVAVGIDLRTYVAIRRSGDRLLIVGSGNMLDEGSRYLDIFSVDAPNLIDSPKWFGNYVRAAVSVLKEDGYSIDGARIWIRSWIPMGSGLGSSGTLLVSLIGAFNELFGFGLRSVCSSFWKYCIYRD